MRKQRPGAKITRTTQPVKSDEMTNNWKAITTNDDDDNNYYNDNDCNSNNNDNTNNNSKHNDK